MPCPAALRRPGTWGAGGYPAHRGLRVRRAGLPPPAGLRGSNTQTTTSSTPYSLRQASLSRATKQLMPSRPRRGRRPIPTQGGGSGLSYHVFRGAMTGRCLASGGVRLRRQGTGREGRGGGGKGGEEKRREVVEWLWLWWVGGKGRRGEGEGEGEAGH